MYCQKYRKYVWLSLPDENLRKFIKIADMKTRIKTNISRVFRAVNCIPGKK
jgi:hypothetical protein